MRLTLDYSFSFKIALNVPAEPYGVRRHNLRIARHPIRSWRVLLLYWLPAIAPVVAGIPAISNIWRTGVWTVALGTMGVACIVPALRWGRVHCYLTGPSSS